MPCPGCDLSGFSWHLNAGEGTPLRQAQVTTTPIHKYVHSLTDTEPPASEVSGSLKKCVRTYEMLHYYPISVILTAGACRARERTPPACLCDSPVTIIADGYCWQCPYDSSSAMFNAKVCLVDLPTSSECIKKGRHLISVSLFYSQCFREIAQLKTGFPFLIICFSQLQPCGS